MATAVAGTTECGKVDAVVTGGKAKANDTLMASTSAHPRRPSWEFWAGGVTRGAQEEGNAWRRPPMNDTTANETDTRCIVSAGAAAVLVMTGSTGKEMLGGTKEDAARVVVFFVVGAGPPATGKALARLRRCQRSRRCPSWNASRRMGALWSQRSSTSRTSCPHD